MMHATASIRGVRIASRDFGDEVSRGDIIAELVGLVPSSYAPTETIVVEITTSRSRTAFVTSRDDVPRPIRMTRGRR